MSAAWVRVAYARHRFDRVHLLLEVGVREPLDQPVGLHLAAPAEPALQLVGLELEEAVCGAGEDRLCGVFGEHELNADSPHVDVEGRLDERDEVRDVSGDGRLQGCVFEDEVVEVEEVRVSVLSGDAGQRGFELFISGQVSVVLAQREELALKVEFLDFLEARQLAPLPVQEGVQPLVLVTALPTLMDFLVSFMSGGLFRSSLVYSATMVSSGSVARYSSSSCGRSPGRWSSARC